MDQPDTVPKKLVLDSSDVLFDSVMKRQPVPMPAEIPQPDKPNRFGLNQSQPVDFGKLWNPSNELPKLAIEVSPGVHLGLSFESAPGSKSDSHPDVLGERTRSKNALFNGAGIFLQRRF